MGSIIEANKGFESSGQKDTPQKSMMNKAKGLVTQAFGVHTGLKIFFILITSAIVALLVIIINPQAATSDIILLLSSSTVALIGVSITGYIFSSDSLRKQADDDYKYIYATEEHKKGILDQLKTQFAVAVILIVFFTVVAHFDTEGIISMFMFSLLILLFTSFTIWSISLDIKMMEVDVGLQEAALKLLDRQKEELEQSDLIININPEEYIELAKTPGLSGNYEFVRENKLGENKYVIRVFRGKESQTVAKKGADRSKTYLYRDMIDEFSPDLALTVFEGVESIICKIAGVATVELHQTDRKRLESALGVGTGRKEDTGMSDDIVEYYFELAKYRDNFFIIKDNDVKENASSRRRVYSKYYCVDRVDNVFLLEDDLDKKKDIVKSKRADDYEYIHQMTPFTYVLRYELCKKLSGMDLSGLNLASFDFSYGNLKKTYMKGTLLMNAAFYSCNLQGANMVGCDLTDATMKYANCEDADFTDAKINNISLDNVTLHGAKFTSAEISNCVFPVLKGLGANFQNASLINCLIKSCHFPDSNLHNANIVMGNIVRTVFKDADMVKSKFASCIVEECNMFGCDFTEATINFSTLKNTSFMISKFENAEMTSNTCIRDSFDNCQIKSVNWIGSQLFSCSFNSAQVSDCDFTKAIIMPYRLKEKTRDKLKEIIEKDEKVLGKDNRHKIVGDEICNFTNAFMKECLYTDAIIKYADFTFAIMLRSVISNTIYDHCEFDYAEMTGIYFADTKMRDCLFRYTTLANSSITSCNISNCNFYSASMKGVTVTDSTFINCTFKNIDAVNLKFIDTRWEKTDLTEIIDELKDVPGGFMKITIKGNENCYKGR